AILDRSRCQRVAAVFEAAAGQPSQPLPNNQRHAGYTLLFIPRERDRTRKCLKRRSATLLTWGISEMTTISTLLIGTASVLVWGIGGAALDFSALDFLADATDVAHAASAPSYHWINAANLSKDDYRWAQVELHTLGLYTGTLDGVPGP